MGKLNIGPSNSNTSIKQEQPVTITNTIIEERIVEMPVEIIKEVEVEKIVYVDRPVEIIKEIPIEVIKEVPTEIIKTVEVPVEVVKEIEKIVYIPQEIVKRVNVYDIEALLIERESVRNLKKSNAILRALFITYIVLSLTIMGVLIG